MEDKQFTKLLNVLKDINTKLNILISLQKLTVKPPQLGKEENTILNLCNGKNSVDDMIKITNKKRNNVEVLLNRLRKKGLIRTSKINKKTVYVKI